MAKSIATSQAEPREDEFPLLAHLDKMVEGLRKRAPAALRRFDEEAIHQARVSTRRLKAGLDLLAPVLEKEGRQPFSRLLRRLRRRLGPLRDLDVMIGHLHDPARPQRQAPAAAWLIARLERQRQAARESAGQRPRTSRVLGQLGGWWGLRESIIENRDAVGSLLAESLHLQLDAFAEQADRLSLQQKAVGGAGNAPASAGAGADDVARRTHGDGSDAPHPSGPTPTGLLDPHELRIAGKALRYTLEMGVAQGHALPAGVAKAFKKMQEALGLWHDYVVLTETAMRVPLEALLPHHDAAMAGQLLNLARATLIRSTRELHRFRQLWLEQGEALTRDIRAAFPLTHAAPPPAANPPPPTDTPPPNAGALPANADADANLAASPA